MLFNLKVEFTTLIAKPIPLLQIDIFSGVATDFAASMANTGLLSP